LGLREVVSEAQALHATGLSKRYGETVALANVDLGLPANKIIGLVGENGAGKSTLLNILSGIVRPDTGGIEVHGVPAKLESYALAQRLGVSRVFQEQALILNIPVFENVLLGAEAQFTSGGQFLRRRRMIELAQSMMDEAGASIDVRRITSDLTFSERQLVEIVRACMASRELFGVTSPIVLFDEPTASLEKAHERVFRHLIEKLRAAGAGLFVSHRLGEVLELCDEIVVLKDGRHVGAVDPADADERSLHRLMVGRERDTDYYHEAEQISASHKHPAFSVRNFATSLGAKRVSFDVMPGEIVGIGGLLESGKSELGRAIVGVDAVYDGEVRIGTGLWNRPKIQELVATGLGYVPAERLTEGMIAAQPVAWNISSASGGDLFANKCGVWKHKLEAEVSRGLIDRLKIKGATPQAPCNRLSGGNQQKVVLSRWLARDLQVLVLDNPTRGVDAGAKEEIYALLRVLAREGVAIVLITDELLELIGMSNRILIMQYGGISTTIDAPVDDKPSEQRLVEAMLGTPSTNEAAAEAA